MKRILAVGPVAMIVLASAVAVVAAPTPARADDCITVDMAVQLNQYPLMPDLARRFNGSDDAEVDGRCIHVSVSPKSSGAAATLLEQGWPNPAQNGPKPVVWSPAANSWRLILNQRLTDAGRPEMAPEGTPEMVSPLVIAMPKEMATALGWPNTAIGYSGHPRARDRSCGWGAKNQPMGLVQARQDESQLLDQRPVVARSPSTTRSPARRTDSHWKTSTTPTVQQKARDVESAVVHYGDTTLTFLNNMYAADQRDAPLGAYASAIAVEEQSVINYNNGNPDGKLDPGEKPRKPNAPVGCDLPEGRHRSSPTTPSSSSTPSG